jgi:putative hydrolase of the HAD superfamily
MIRAVLFDAVGTLIHLREPVGEIYARFAREQGIQLRPDVAQAAFARVIRTMPPMAFPGCDAHTLRDRERDWWRTVVRSVFEAAGVTAPAAAFAACFDRLFSHFAGAGAWRAGDGAAEMLERLRGRGLRTGIVSNFDHRLPAVLEALALAPLFDLVVLPGDVGAAKPDARIFVHALQRLGLRPEEAVYVGDDADDDIAAAERAGLRAIDAAALPDLRSLESLLA